MSFIDNAGSLAVVSRSFSISSQSNPALPASPILTSPSDSVPGNSSESVSLLPSASHSFITLSPSAPVGALPGSKTSSMSQPGASETPDPANQASPSMPVKNPEDTPPSASQSPVKPASSTPHPSGSSPDAGSPAASATPTLNPSTTKAIITKATSGISTRVNAPSSVLLQSSVPPDNTETTPPRTAVLASGVPLPISDEGNNDTSIPNHRPTLTSTITDVPESTFSNPFRLTVTNPDDGQTSVTTPPFVTLLSTSTEPDGSFVTYTHVIANPTGFNAMSDNHTFLNNKGAMAGVFITVGIAAAALTALGFLLYRRRRRHIRRARWLDGIQPQPAPGDPFQDPPPMRSAEIDGQNPSGGATRGILDDEFTPNTIPMAHGVMMAAAGPSEAHIGQRQVQPQNPFHDSYGYQHSLNNAHTKIGLAITSERPPSTHSAARSSPSIYPASLPSEEEEHEAKTPPPPHHPILAPIATKAPPVVPPRSIYRPKSAKLEHDRRDSLTPPSSASSHTYTNMTPELAKPLLYAWEERVPDNVMSHPKGPLDLFNRRTLLDVRPRPSRDNVTGVM